ncbi:MAG: hypothetical protein RDV41_01950 [Planctomycetota bacterium]|nr:hypothetical protein [Planctomycetota bacterium]
MPARVHRSNYKTYGATASVSVVVKVGWGWFSVTYKHVIAKWSFSYLTWTILSATV